MAGNTVKIKAVLDDKVSGKLDRIRDNFDRLGKNKGASALLQGVGLGAGVSAFNLLGAAASGAVTALTATIDAASALRETTTLTGQVFKENAGEMQEWAAGAASAFGQSKREALDFAANFGNAFVNVGLALDDSSARAKEMTELAADLGSAFNAGADEAALALRSGLLGESEPLRRFGVFLSEAATQAKAVELGIAKAGKKLTDAQKVTARYAIIMEDTVAIQGTFGADTDSLADAQKSLAASTENLAARLGEQLIPRLAEVVSGAADAAENIDKLAVAADGAALFGIELTDWAGHAGNVFELLTTSIRAPQIALGMLADVADGAKNDTSKAMSFLASHAEREGGRVKVALGQVGFAASGMADTVQVETVSATEYFTTMVDNVVGQAERSISNAFDPTIEAYKLMGLNAKESAAERAVEAGKATAAEIAALAEARQAQAEQLLAMARAGQTNSTAYKNGIKDLARNAKEAKGEAHVALMSVYRDILTVEAAGKKIPLNIVVNTLMGQMSIPIGTKAEGGRASGLTIVGEKGPELLNLPNGSYVHDNASTMQMLGGGQVIPNGAGQVAVGGGGSTIVFQSLWPPTPQMVRDVYKLMDAQGWSNLESAAPFNGR